MNCKPGDLAVCVSVGKHSYGIAKEVAIKTLGIPVRVTHLRPPENKVQCFDAMVWNFEKPIEVVVYGVAYSVTGAADHEMRPIRDPGDDAVDEVIQRLGTPHKEVA